MGVDNIYIITFIFGLARVSNADAHIYLTFSLKVRCFIMLSFEHFSLPLCAIDK